MKLMMEEVKPKINDIVVRLGVDAVGLIPPTIRREVQIMKFIQSELPLALPVIDIKNSGDYPRSSKVALQSSGTHPQR